MIPLTIPEIKRLLAALTTRALPRRLVIHWEATSSEMVYEMATSRPIPI